MTGSRSLDPATARETAADAWIWGYPLLCNYRTLHAQALDPADPRYIGGFGRFRHYTRPFTPANTDVVTPNNDTPYSWAWLDLRAEPWVLTVPDTDRYHLLPVHELDTVYAGFLGSGHTAPGDHLLAGPGWRAAVPDGIASTVRADTYLVGIVGRTYLAGPDDTDDLQAVQEQYRLRPLHEYTGGPAPDGVVATPAWPRWDDAVPYTAEAFAVLDRLLAYFPVLPDEARLRGRMAALGIDGSGGFDPAALAPDLADALTLGIADARRRLDEAVADTGRSDRLFGTRAQMGDRYLDRAVAADLGLYGLPTEEAWYSAWTADRDGHPLDAERRGYTLTFTPGHEPPARFFWSATMYRLPERLLVENAVNRYSVGDRTPGLVRDPDGSLTLHVRHERPEDPAELANWLPAPAGPFTVVLRVYGPDRAVLRHTWSPPPLLPEDAR